MNTNSNNSNSNFSDLKDTIKESYSSGKQAYQKAAYSNAANALLVTSPNPLKNELYSFKQGYLFALLLGLAGIIYRPFWGLGMLFLMIYFCIDIMITNQKRDCLCKKHFKFDSSIDNNTLFEKVMPALTKKYGMMVERRDDGVVSVHHQNVIYDIIITKDDSFNISWRFSLGRTLLPKAKYKSYKKFLVGMGIIAYEVQAAFDIANRSSSSYQSKLEDRQ